MPELDLNLIQQIVAIIVGCFTIFQFVIKPIVFLVNKLVMSKDKREARKYISIISKENRKHLNASNNFFGEKTNNNLYFYNKNKIIYNGKNISNRQAYRKSYILIGQAGCGKSSILQADYLHNSKKRFYLRNINSCHIYLTADKTLYYFKDEERYNMFVNNLAAAKFRKVYLYLDGIDELDANIFMEIKSRIIDLSRATKTQKITFKISCRNNFYDSFLSINENKDFKELTETTLELADWTVEQLKEIGLKYVKIFCNKSTRSEIVEKIIEDIRHEDSWIKDANSPLLIKMYVYILLYNPSKMNLENSYDFYTNFVKSMVITNMAKKGIPTSSDVIDQQLNSFANRVFLSYSKHKKEIPIDTFLPTLTKDLFNQDHQEATLVHETFYEYFVARNYINQINDNKITEQTLLVLCQSYSNNYADFITDAICSIVKDGLSEEFTKKLIFIYSCTLSKTNLQKLNFDFSKYSLDRSLLNKLDKTSEDDNDKKFFILKYEIVFRLGRITNNNQLAADFLKFIYYNDENIRVKTNISYYLVVLKRCCAISSSFLSNEEIEIDYVKKMLDFMPNYESNYNLANRSHTLMFYGDVLNVGIFEFQDDVITYSYEKAFRKRIERLKADLPLDLSEMYVSKTKRTYLFRLFDLATIYTFIVFKKHNLTDDELDAIESCNIYFKGASEERTSLMQTIKEKILEQK